MTTVNQQFIKAYKELKKAGIIENNLNRLLKRIRGNKFHWFILMQ